MCTTAALARPLPAGQSGRAGGIPQAVHGGPQPAECGPAFERGRRRRGREGGKEREREEEKEGEEEGEKQRENTER